MPPLLAEFLEKLRQHGLQVAAAALFGVGGWWIGHWRARARWRRREFLDRLNVSLNMISDGTLRIRTLLEKNCEEVFLNRAAVEAVLAAARQTKPDNPVLPLPATEYWFYLNAVLNELAEKFAVGVLSQDLGLGTQSARYVICLTHECAGEVRTRKIRAMVIRSDLLATLPAECPKLESPNHTTRWETLQVLKSRRASHPHEFLDVELVVAAPR